MSESVQVAKYKITGLVDYFDEQGVVAGQFPIGSEQELPVEVGQKHVESGNAELIEGSEGEVETEEAPEEGATGSTGEENSEESDDSDDEDEGGDDDEDDDAVE